MTGIAASLPGILMDVTVIPVTAFAQNCSLLICQTTGKAAVVDPGGDVDRILAACGSRGVEPEKIFVTHGHIDHVGGVGELAARLSVPVEGPHPDDAFWIASLDQQSRYFGFPEVTPFVPTRWLQHGDEVVFGAVKMQVRHCPGHTPGHIVFYESVTAMAFVGDVLFKGSIGRTDFPRGDHATLLRSIREQLWPLGDEVRFVPGHGPMSTFGIERSSNPFVRGES